MLNVNSIDGIIAQKYSSDHLIGSFYIILILYNNKVLIFVTTFDHNTSLPALNTHSTHVRNYS